MGAPFSTDARYAAPATGAFLFFGAFGIYLVTLAPAVTFWDSGELAAASYLLGISHQPGYPLYSITGRGFALIPFGNVAFRLNLMSATFAALTASVVYRTALDLMRARTAAAGEGSSASLAAAVAAALALVMALAKTYWSQAVVAEVYALNAFFLAMLVMLHVRSRLGLTPPARYAALSGFLFGLGVVNHVSLLVYLPALALSWAFMRPNGRVVVFVQGVFFILLGLSVCLYLPVRSAAGPGLDIGHPDTWARFLWVVKWHDYALLVRQLPRLVSGFLAGAGVSVPMAAAGIVAALAAAWRIFKEDRRTALPLVVFLALYVLVVAAQAAGAKGDEKFGLAAKFYIPALVAGTVLAGALVAGLLASAGGRRYALPLLAVLLLASGLLVYRNLPANDHSRNYIAFDYAQNSLKSVDDGGVLLTWGDNGVFPLWYLRLVERYRDDTALVHTPLLTYDWYLRDVEGMLGRKAGFMPAYFLGENVYRIYKSATPARRMSYDYSAVRFLELDEKTLTARGLVYYEGSVPGGEPWGWYVFRGVDDPGVFKGPIEKNIMDIYRYQRSLRRK